MTRALSLALQAKTEYWADIIYKNLSSLTRAEDTSLAFYGMKLDKQHATEADFKRYAQICARLFVEGWQKKKKTDLSDQEVLTLLKSCLDKGWVDYNEK